MTETEHADRELCAEGLRSSLLARKYSTARKEGTCVHLDELHFDFHVLEAKRLGRDAGFGVAIEARATGRQDDGIRVTVVGVGDDLVAGARDAGEQWAMSVFPVLVSYLFRTTKNLDVVALPMVVAVEDNAERFGWNVRLGPVISRC